MSASIAQQGFVNSLRQERALLWAVLVSIGLHALALLGMSRHEMPAPPAQLLTVLTATLAPAAQAPTVAPQPSPSLRPRAEPQPREKPAPARVPRPVADKPVAAPAARKTPPADIAKPALPEPAGEPAAAAAAVPSAAPAAPAQAKAATQAPAGSRSEATERPGNAADAGTLEQYRLALIAATRRYKRYPAIAMEKGWQGRVVVRLAIGANGMLAGTSITTSSGHDVLDNQAIDMLKKGKTTVQIPASLRGRGFNIDVPVIFNLDNPSG